MSGAELGLALSVFLASAVECVEALTIVLAVGSSRSWSSALSGAGAGAVVLAVAVAVLGAGVSSIPIDPLRIAIGALLLVVGSKWLRKAVLRQAGLKAQRDEDLAYHAEIEAARSAARGEGFDRYAFAVAGKGVLLEGMEVAVIVLTLGADHHHVGLAAICAGVAALLVALVGVAVRKPLARVPENAMKFAVGVMLSAYGVFWGLEGLGLAWPGGDAMLLALVAFVLGASMLAVRVLRARHDASR